MSPDVGRARSYPGPAVAPHALNQRAAGHTGQVRGRPLLAPPADRRRGRHRRTGIDLLLLVGVSGLLGFILAIGVVLALGGVG